MTFSLPAQSSTFGKLPDKDALTEKYFGTPIRDLRTPALIIDRAIFARNCADMHQRTKMWNWKFRAHIKTHKATEGVRLQLQSSADTTHAVVVSTLEEAHGIIRSGLVEDGTVRDILYGLPVGANKLGDLANLGDLIRPYNAVIRIMIDSPDHVRALDAYNEKHPREPWSAFFKIDLGTTKRAGLVPSSKQFAELLAAVIESPSISLYGFYSHAGTSYASKTLEDASEYLTAEISAVLDAAEIARPLLPGRSLVLSVGATPTAHAFSRDAISALQTRLDAAGGAELELHAGNYPMLDLQQVATSLVTPQDVSQRVLASVVSYYPGRGEGGADEAMCDAGGVALSKDVGPILGFGDVMRIIRPSSDSQNVPPSGLGCEETGWRIGRTSQEHGILTRITAADVPSTEVLRVGDMIEIIGQHACYIAASFPWYYVIDSSENDRGEPRVCDIWVPYKGW